MIGIDNKQSRYTVDVFQQNPEDRDSGHSLRHTHPPPAPQRANKYYVDVVLPPVGRAILTLVAVAWICRITG